MNLQEKLKKLENILRDMKGFAVAFSGGVDSSLLLKVASTLEEVEVVAVTIHAAVHAGFEIEEARELGEDLQVDHRIIPLEVLDHHAFKDHPVDRCYHCKKVVFTRIFEEAHSLGLDFVADGSNVDDISDYRPGLKALEELSVRSPLKEAGLTKAEIRSLSADYGMTTATKPAYACLATRIPYHQQVFKEDLEKIEKGEVWLKDQGFEQYRVRLHGDAARIEVLPHERARFFNMDFMDQVQAIFKEFGFAHVALDLGGYRTGSMNVGIPEGTEA